MRNDDVREHFDGLADTWDSIAVHPPAKVERALSALGGLEGMFVVDVGSGTGVLIPYLLGRVGEGGGVLALDISPRMIEAARRSHAAPNLGFEVADFALWRSPRPADAIVAYSCYPHFREAEGFWLSASANLAPGGLVLVAHIESRAAINALHGDRASSISVPLGPAAEEASYADRAGFETLLAEEGEDSWTLLCRLPRP